MMARMQSEKKAMTHTTSHTYTNTHTLIERNTRTHVLHAMEPHHKTCTYVQLIKRNVQSFLWILDFSIFTANVSTKYFISLIESFFVLPSFELNFNVFCLIQIDLKWSFQRSNHKWPSRVIIKFNQTFLYLQSNLKC